MTVQIPDALARALRTALQTAIGVFLSLVILPHAAPGTVPTWDVLKAAGLAALFAGVVALLSGLQNWLEDTGKVPAVLGKTPTPPGVPPGVPPTVP